MNNKICLPVVLTPSSIDVIVLKTFNRSHRYFTDWNDIQLNYFWEIASSDMIFKPGLIKNAGKIILEESKSWDVEYVLVSRRRNLSSSDIESITLSSMDDIVNERVPMELQAAFLRFVETELSEVVTA